MKNPRSRPVVTATVLGLAAVTALGWAGLSYSQDQELTTLQAIEAHRAMLQDGNPADLYAMRGEQLWRERRGPANASLERCDLGLGPGVVKGAFVQLPRFFPDTNRVQDLESRLLTCMQTLQGIDISQVSTRNFIRPGETANVVAIATWVADQSKGMRFNVPNSHPAEQTMYHLGERMFFTRAGTHDFSCATCHSIKGGRIRLQDLPLLNDNPPDKVGFAAWPAYRISSGQMWSMQHRINDCFRQMRFPEPKFASDATIALSVYMGVHAKGTVSDVPAIRR